MYSKHFPWNSPHGNEFLLWYSASTPPSMYDSHDLSARNGTERPVPSASRSGEAKVFVSVRSEEVQPRGGSREHRVNSVKKDDSCRPSGRDETMIAGSRGQQARWIDSTTPNEYFPAKSASSPEIYPHTIDVRAAAGRSGLSDVLSGYSFGNPIGFRCPGTSVPDLTTLLHPVSRERRRHTNRSRTSGPFSFASGFRRSRRPHRPNRIRRFRRFTHHVQARQMASVAQLTSTIRCQKNHVILLGLYLHSDFW